MMPAKLNLFVFEYHTGSWAGSSDTLMMHEGARIRDAIVCDLLACGHVNISCASVPQAPPPDLSAAERAHANALSLVSPHAGETAQDFVLREAGRHDLVWAILPETDGLLTTFCVALGPQKWVGCNSDSIRLATSKHHTLRYLAALGIQTPLAFMDDPAITHWIVKPDDGAGSMETRRHGARASAQADIAARQNMPGAGRTHIMEPWIEGDIMSLSLLCDHGQAELLSINRLEMQMDLSGNISQGAVQVGAAEGDARLRAACERLARQVAHAMPGLRGFAGLDVIAHPTAGLVLIEVNPRATCAYEGHRLFAARRGRPLAQDILALFAPTSSSTQQETQHV
ncbi:ATP-grasp domain-containing protein [Xanthobacter sp. TB0139]|uniref:ATP-grasp domain-containing protein n=1 Tax=Xanthobacter sp. TB0139 TaxID=3459178 RepID=UPI004039C4E9